MQKLINKAWPFLLIILIVNVFFYPVWLQNKVALPVDITVGAYFPWLDYKYQGFPTGIPVKNPITSDVVSFMFPMQMLAIDMLKAGQWPLWNNLILGGTPLMANFQSASFSPTNFVYFLLPKLEAWNIQIILQLILAATFSFLLLREFERSKLASVAGGIFYAFSGFLMIWLEWNGHSLVAAFLPLIILLVLKYLKTEKVIWGVILSFCLALQIFSGYPQIILYEVLALFILVIIFDTKLFLNFKKLLLLGFFGLLGIGLAAIQILPGLELLSLSQRKIEGVINVEAFLPFQQIITLVAPDFFGNHSTKNYWGSGDYTLNTIYGGVVVAILAGLGVLTYAKEKSVKFALSLIGLSLVISLQSPLSLLLKESGLLGLQAASAHRSLFLANLGFAILAAFGLDSLGKISFKRVIRALYLPGILIVGFGLTTVGLVIFFQSNQDSVVIQKTLIDLHVGIKNLILPLVFLLLTGSSLIVSLIFKRYTSFMTVLIIILAILELFRFGWKFTPFTERNLVFPTTPVLEFLQQQEKPFRVIAEDVVPINMMMNYNLETLEGYDAVYPVNFAKFLSTLNSNQVSNSPMGRYASISNFDSNLINIANVKYILALKRDNNNSPDENGEVPEKFQNFKKVFADKTVVVLENENALPRSKIFYDWDVLDNHQQLEKLIDKDFPYNEKIILSNNPGIKKGIGTGSAAIIEDFNKKNIHVNSSTEGILLITDSYFPGWKALIDGKAAEIIKANYNFMAVPILAGDHNVELIYQPDSFEKGKMISLISVIILFTIYFSSLLFKKAR